MPEERPKGLLDEIDELEAKRKKRKKQAKAEDDELDIGKVW